MQLQRKRQGRYRDSWKAKSVDINKVANKQVRHFIICNAHKRRSEAFLLLVQSLQFFVFLARLRSINNWQQNNKLMASYHLWHHSRMHRDLEHGYLYCALHVHLLHLQTDVKSEEFLSMEALRSSTSHVKSTSTHVEQYH